jgi:hypothetical protein
MLAWCGVMALMVPWGLVHNSLSGMLKACNMTLHGSSFELVAKGSLCQTIQVFGDQAVLGTGSWCESWI